MNNKKYQFPVPAESYTVIEKTPECTHYVHRAILVTPCCNKLYKCHNCHDEHESHLLKRNSLKEIICTKCNLRQELKARCIKCKVFFGRYTCLKCKIFDDRNIGQYHCKECGVCRVGGRENYFHCKICGICFTNSLKIIGHKCIENASKRNCPICLEYIHSSREPCHVPECGHLLHKSCCDKLIQSGHCLCPVCKARIAEEPPDSENLNS